MYFRPTTLSFKHIVESYLNTLHAEIIYTSRFINVEIKFISLLHVITNSKPKKAQRSLQIVEIKCAPLSGVMDS